ncbi:MAG: hypothetical protein M1415_11690 [Firmicutes bacterium]|jgi:hypothetical protein|nr:hypothetical protein [Bacillota bacterium]MCL5065218.1 hypothetical protein [Bacillota bacterium]
MNRQEVRVRVKEAMDEAIGEHGYVSPLQVLIRLQVVSPKSVEDWRAGRILALERVAHMNLSKLNALLDVMKELATLMDLTPSWTAYQRKTRGGRMRLRFSKSGDPNTERKYSTHFVSRQLRAAKRAAKFRDGDAGHTDVGPSSDDDAV